MQISCHLHDDNLTAEHIFILNGFCMKTRFDTKLKANSEIAFYFEFD